MSGSGQDHSPESRRVFQAVVNSPDTEDRIDEAEASDDFSHLATAERWINRRVSKYLGASIYGVDRHIDDRGQVHDTDVSQRVYSPDWSRQRFVLDEIVEADS